MIKTAIVSLITALIMFIIGAYWMFIWLIGTNGYSEAKGTRILLGNLILVFFSIAAASLMSGWATKKLQVKTGWSLLVIAPLTIFAAIILAVIALFIGSLMIIGIFGATR